MDGLEPAYGRPSDPKGSPDHRPARPQALDPDRNGGRTPKTTNYARAPLPKVNVTRAT
jgi:hypothetical protein